MLRIRINTPHTPPETTRALSSAISVLRSGKIAIIPTETFYGLAAEQLLQLGVTPGVYSGYMPVTGGTFQGQITAPSVLMGPVGGTQYEVVTKNSFATTAAAGIVKQMAAIADISTSISNPPTQAEVTAIKDKVNALLAAARTALLLTP